MYDVKEHSAGQVIIDFLTDLNMTKVLQTKVLSTYFRLERLVKFGRKNYKQNEAKREKLSFIWDTQAASLMTNLRKSGLEEDLAKEDKILQITEKTK